jgi:hypothetical protein
MAFYSDTEEIHKAIDNMQIAFLLADKPEWVKDIKLSESPENYNAAFIYNCVIMSRLGFLLKQDYNFVLLDMPDESILSNAYGRYSRATIDLCLGLVATVIENFFVLHEPLIAVAIANYVTVNMKMLINENRYDLNTAATMQYKRRVFEAVKDNFNLDIGRYHTHDAAIAPDSPLKYLESKGVRFNRCQHGLFMVAGTPKHKCVLSTLNETKSFICKQ